MFRSRLVAQLVSALLSVLPEVPSSILSDSNVCSDFSLICIAVALNSARLYKKNPQSQLAPKLLHLVASA